MESYENPLEIFKKNFATQKLEVVAELYQNVLQFISFSQIDFIYYFNIALKRGLRFVEWWWNNIPEFYIIVNYYGINGKSFWYDQILPTWIMLLNEKAHDPYLRFNNTDLNDMVFIIERNCNLKIFKLKSGQIWEREYLYKYLLLYGLIYCANHDDHHAEITIWLLQMLKKYFESDECNKILINIFLLAFENSNIKLISILFEPLELNKSIDGIDLFMRVYESENYKTEMLDWICDKFNIPPVVLMRVFLKKKEGPWFTINNNNRYWLVDKVINHITADIIPKAKRYGDQDFSKKVDKLVNRYNL